MTDNQKTTKQSSGVSPKAKPADKSVPKTTRDLNPAGAKSGYQTR